MSPIHSLIQDLASFVCNADAAALPSAERAIQRRHVADTAVAAVAGRLTSEGRALRSLLPRDGLADAIGRQAAIIRHTEIDDIHTRSCTTPSSVAVPVALALARTVDDASTERVAAAIWAGTELMARLGTAIDGARILARGIWPTYFAAPLAAAATTARMLGLRENETAHALSLALMLAAGRSGRFHGGVPGRCVLLALAVANGVRAAHAARDGVSGDPALLDGPWLRDAHGITADLDALTAGLGSGSIYAQLSLKPFCSAKQALAATEALTALLAEGVAATAIDSITVRVPAVYARMIATKPELGSRASAIVGAGFQLGLAACRPERLFDIERGAAVHEPDVLAFAERVEVVGDDTLLDTFPASFPAEIEVVAGGTTVRKRITATAGDPSRPLDDADIRRKAQRVFAQIGETRPADGVVDLGLAALQDRGSCRRLADAMADNTGTS
jgi:2-methylcitrate dehydratase PrpD